MNLQNLKQIVSEADTIVYVCKSDTIGTLEPFQGKFLKINVTEELFSTYKESLGKDACFVNLDLLDVGIEHICDPKCSHPIWETLN